MRAEITCAGLASQAVVKMELRPGSPGAVERMEGNQW